MKSAAIRLENVSVAYARHAAVTGVSGTFAAGSLTAIVGSNGAGKTTLLKALVGELPLSSGRIERGGLAARDFGYLPQAAEIDRSFPITVADIVLLGAWRRTGAFGGLDAASAKRAGDALATVGLAGLERRLIGSLSAGQFQRVLFARLLVQDSGVILLDEPFAAVDARTTGDLLAIVGRWHAEGRTVVAVLHSFDQVRAHFPETLLLARAPIAWGPTASVLTGANLSSARVHAQDWEGDIPAALPLERSAA